MCKNKERQESWSDRYKKRTGELKGPALFIKNNIEQLKKGTVLDLACGDGRNTIYLAKEGFDVTGADFSEEALERLAMFGKKEDVDVKTVVTDVDDKDEILGLGKFDNIIISNFKPTIEIFKTLHELLTQDGIIIFVTFNFRQAESSDFPRKFCLEENEFKDVSDKLELVKLEILKEGHNHLDGYIFKKKVEIN